MTIMWTLTIEVRLVVSLSTCHRDTLSLDDNIQFRLTMRCQVCQRTGVRVTGQQCQGTRLVPQAGTTRCSHWWHCHLVATSGTGIWNRGHVKWSGIYNNGDNNYKWCIQQWAIYKMWLAPPLDWPTRCVIIPLPMWPQSAGPPTLTWLCFTGRQQ